CDQTQRGNKTEHAPIQRRTLCKRKQLTAPVTNQQTEGTADDGQQDAFGQELTDESAARGSQRQPDRNFLLTNGCARKQEVRNIGANDQQHQSDDDTESRCRPPRGVIDVVDASTGGIDFQVWNCRPVLIPRQRSLVGRNGSQIRCPGLTGSR